MPQRTMQPVPAFVPEALNASEVGVWETDFESDCTIGDSTTALLFGIDPNLASAGLPFAEWIKGIHPEDRPLFHEKITPLRTGGGRFVTEYRTCPAPQIVRWILARGYYELDERTGRVIGRGIVIDITDSKLNGHFKDSAPLDDEEPLERVATHALKARHTIDEIDEPLKTTLRHAADTLLLAVGHALAQHNSRH